METVCVKRQILKAEGRPALRRRTAKRHSGRGAADLQRTSSRAHQLLVEPGGRPAILDSSRPADRRAECGTSTRAHASPTHLRRLPILEDRARCPPKRA